MNLKIERLSREAFAPFGDVIEASDGRLTLSIPIQIKRRSGRKLVTLPNGETAPVRPWDVAPTPLQLALARATAGWRCWNRGRLSR